MHIRIIMLVLLSLMLVFLECVALGVLHSRSVPWNGPKIDSGSGSVWRSASTFGTTFYEIDPRGLKKWDESSVKRRGDRVILGTASLELEMALNAHRLWADQAEDIPIWLRSMNWRDAERIVIVQHGWPFRCVSCERYSMTPHIALEAVGETIDTMRFESESWSVDGIAFGVNALIHGVFMFVCLVGFHFLVRARRRMSGMCLTCGYIIDGSGTAVCPECGKEHHA